VSAVGGEPELVIAGATSAAIHPRDGRFVFAREGRLWMLDRSAAKDPRPFGQAPFEGTGVVRAFSPDGAKLPVVKDGALWLLAYPGGAARQIRIDEFFAMGSTSWMPDSRHFVTETPHAGLPGFVMVDTDAVTTRTRTFLRSPTPLLNPSVSPDGRRLAFVTGTVSWNLAEVTLDDGRVRQLGSGSRVSWYPSLAPDGMRLAFANSREYGFEIREMTLAPSGELVARTIAAMTEVETTSLHHVKWSPDGARVLFSVSAPSGIRLMVAPAAGGRALPLDPKVDDSRDGVWSPDGTRIVYGRQVGDEHQIVAVRVGTSAAPVVVKRWSVQDPADRTRVPVDWSPDGRWILTRQGPSVFLMAADGSNERPLSSAVMSPSRVEPIFSRDGREVLMLRRDASAPRRPWRLFALDVASGGERLVVTVDFPTTADDVAGLSISPDGTRLYTSFADWPFDIWMLEGFR
jgi:Tol biopolymer transport system component